MASPPPAPPPPPPRALPFLTLLALTVAVASLSALAAIALTTGWPGRERPTQFCEDAPGLVRQPANTWSNLGFVLVGLAVAVRADLDRARGTAPRNPMTRTWTAPAVYALATVLLGPGSMAMHASNTDWGTRLDVGSMLLWASACAAYSLGRWRGWGSAAFAGTAAALGATTVALYLARPHGTPIFAALLALMAAGEALRARDDAGDRRLLLAAGGAFALALAIWLPSRTGGPLCDPASRLQGHALWHVLCALSAGLIYLYYRSERGALRRSGP